MSSTSPTGLTAIDEVTVLEGSSFCRSNRAGDISPYRPHGVFVKDTRIISTWELLLDDQPVEPLGVVSQEPFAATFLGRYLLAFEGTSVLLLVAAVGGVVLATKKPEMRKVGEPGAFEVDRPERVPTLQSAVMEAETHFDVVTAAARRDSGEGDGEADG